MPKIVDPEERRREITRAVFRLVERSGIEAATLRNIADEAGLAIGSVRHYFTNHAAVMDFAMRELTEQTSRRVLAHVDRITKDTSPHDRRLLAESILAEFLPLDDQRRTETRAWLDFLTAARTRPELRSHAERLHNGLRTVVRRLLGRAMDGGTISADLDIELETERLAALLDGLTTAMVLPPAILDADTALRVLRRHLDELTATR
ncbi:TetR/AcrR family transcriptional regulator [Stackebrandtia endophytica]|nr:TetR family transcriptional regulator C-terminal domain-containing protein [Stackebrandtia endophytica]